jgi:hypothetical protein
MAWKVPNTTFKLEWDDDGEFCQIPLSVYGAAKGMFAAKVDPDAFPDFSQFNWHLFTPKREIETHYARRTVSNVLLPEGTRRKVYECMQNRVLGLNVKDGLVDHINGDGLDNRMDNLRKADTTQNAQNARKLDPNATSKYKGVSWSVYRWKVYVTVRGRFVWIGSFKRRIVEGIDQGEIDAAVAYDQAACKYFGCFARLNFPQERNVVTLGGTKYRMVYLPTGSEKTVMEKKIQNLREMKLLEIFQILGDKTIPEIEELCHYLSCGVDQLAGRIKNHDPDNPESVVSFELQQRGQRALLKETHVE